jgi:4-amino-4-deoxy-L-arabinose transferase-like glycosyltransferase
MAADSLIARRPAVCAVGVLLLALIIAAVPAGRRPFWSSDEARFALLAQDVLDHGHWLVAEIRGQLYLNKPQLFFWAVAIVSLPFGRVTELSAAIPAVLSSVATVAGTMAIGRLLWGWPAGLVAGLILATTPLQFEMSHHVLPDVMLNAWLVWGLYWFIRAERAGWALRPLLAFYACLAAGLLCKGPQALAALVAATVATALVGGIAEVRKLRLTLGVVIVLSVAAVVWLIPYQARSHGGFEERVVTGHYVTWYLFGPLLSRLVALHEPLTAFLPWTVLLAAAPWWWRVEPDRGRRRIVLWTATLWLLSALSGNYRARYMLPIFPGLAVLTAEFLTASLGGSARRARDTAAVVCGAVVVVAAIAALFPLASLMINEDIAYFPGAWWERAVLLLLAATACVGLVRGARAPDASGAVVLALALAAIFIVEGVTYPGRYAHAFDVRPLAAAAVASTPPDGTVIGYPDLRLSYDVYLRDRRVIEMSDGNAVAARVRAAPQDVFVMTADRWKALAPGAHPRWRVLASAKVGDRTMVTVGSGP